MENWFNATTIRSITHRWWTQTFSKSNKYRCYCRHWSTQWIWWFTWFGTIRNYTINVYSKVKANERLKNIPVLGPSLIDLKAYEAVGSLDLSIDFVNQHMYQWTYYFRNLDFAAKSNSPWSLCQEWHLYCHCRIRSFFLIDSLRSNSVTSVCVRSLAVFCLFLLSTLKIIIEKDLLLNNEKTAIDIIILSTLFVSLLILN